VNSRAEWAEAAEDLIDNLPKAAEQLRDGQVSHMTGLSIETIKDSLTRREITSRTNPRGALCRPAYRLGDMPLWSPDQVAEYHRRVEALKAETRLELPTVTAEQAQESGLVTSKEIQERFGVHEQTMRRHQRNHENYPRAVAKLARDGAPGVPEHLRDWNAVLTWARVNKIKLPEGWVNRWPTKQPA
jgi:hypothetical protein